MVGGAKASRIIIRKLAATSSCRSHDKVFFFFPGKAFAMVQKRRIVAMPDAIASK